MSRPCRIVPRPRHVIVPHMQLSQNEVLGLNHPNRTPLGAALSEVKPVTRGWSQGWLLTPLPHHTLPREPQTQSYDIASLLRFSCSLFASPLFWKFAHFCTLAKLLQKDCRNLLLPKSHELSARMVYGIYPPSLPPGKSNSSVRGLLQSQHFILGCSLFTDHDRVTLALLSSPPHRTSAHTPD